MTNDVEVKLGAETSALKSGMNEAHAAVKEGVNGIKESFSGLVEHVEKVKGAFLGLTAILAGGALFREAIKGTVEWTGQVAGMSKILGTTTEEASELAVGLKLIGKSTEDYTDASMKLLRQVKMNEEAMNQLGLRTKDAEGNIRALRELTDDAVKVLKDYKEGADRDAAAMYFFGRSAGEVFGLFKLNESTMARAKDLAQQYGLVVGQESVEATKKYKMEMNATKLVFEAMEEKVGHAVLPTLTTLAGWFNDIGPSVVNTFANALKGVLTVIDVLIASVKTILNIWQTAFEVMLDGVKGLGRGLLALIKGDYSQIPEIVKETMVDVKSDLSAGALQQEEIVKGSTDRIKKMWSSAHEGSSGNDPAIGKGTKRFVAPEKGGAGKDDRLGQMKQELQAKKELEGAYFKDYLAEEDRFWSEKLALVNGRSKEDMALRAAIKTQLYSIHKQEATEERAIDVEKLKAASDHQVALLDIQEKAVSNKLALGQINKMKELALIQDLEDKKYAIEVDGLKKKMELYGQDEKEYQKVLDEIQKMDDKHALKMQENSGQMALAQQKVWGDGLKPITSAFEQSINGMIQGTQTFKQGLANIWKSITAEFIKTMVMEPLAKWAAAELAKTSLLESASAIRNALGFGEAIAAGAAKKTEAVSTIPPLAAEAASGAAASVASIPYVGPVMAAAAYAETMAMVMSGMSLASAAGGFGQVPSDMMAMIHKDEMVMPKEFADPLRDQLRSGGGSSGLNITIQAFDSKDVHRALKSGGVLHKALKELHRNMATA